MVKIQVPPLRLLTPRLLPFSSAGLWIAGLTAKAPAHRLIKPAAQTKAAPSAIAPRFASDTDPQCNSDSPELSADMPTAPLRTCTKVRSSTYLRKQPCSSP